MSCANSRAFDRAENEYLTPPDDHLEDCEDCENGRVPNPDYDSAAPIHEREDETVECDECGGSGQIDQRAKARERHQDYLEEKGERDFEEMRDRKREME